MTTRTDNNFLKSEGIGNRSPLTVLYWLFEDDFYACRSLPLNKGAIFGTGQSDVYDLFDTCFTIVSMIGRAKRRG